MSTSVNKIKTYDCDGSDFIIQVGDTIFDDLTGKNAKVIKLTQEDHLIGIWLENDWLGGGRHPWEVSRKKEDEV